ncbi:hypothetical protein HXX76_005568 [Chlamydomonas incerta]|uniref:Uncharacterized protein n=1 Tax=Chlamydomonas incerta TaxID=51695 RepID=A0A835W5E0_CHLIN|nr:hypothetical protein HXX76_005568 [Chlamydomonas incerta]|eukprot:KAG2437953.1 hypothetical protein HXX76_005568 [Chlamydomonas incerta]
MEVVGLHGNIKAAAAEVDMAGSFDGGLEREHKAHILVRLMSDQVAAAHLMCSRACLVGQQAREVELTSCWTATSSFVAAAAAAVDTASSSVGCGLESEAKAGILARLLFEQMADARLRIAL